MSPKYLTAVGIDLAVLAQAIARSNDPHFLETGAKGNSA
jgi:hypothetical protein